MVAECIAANSTILLHITALEKLINNSFKIIRTKTCNSCATHPCGMFCRNAVSIDIYAPLTVQANNKEISE